MEYLATKSREAGAKDRTELVTENAAVKQLLAVAARQNRELATGLVQVSAFHTSRLVMYF
jgi:hypothetical protein